MLIGFTVRLNYAGVCDSPSACQSVIKTGDVRSHTSWWDIDMSVRLVSVRSLPHGFTGSLSILSACFPECSAVRHYRYEFWFPIGIFIAVACSLLVHEKGAVGFWIGRSHDDHPTHNGTYRCNSMRALLTETA